MSTGDESEDTYKVWLGREQQPEPAVHAGEERDHFKNFIDCVVSRKKADLNAPIEEGHISCGLMHLANASYRLGRTINFDPETEQVIGDKEAEELLRDGYARLSCAVRRAGKSLTFIALVEPKPCVSCRAARSR